ncbi:MAG TPA: hypothetical protein VH062_05155 [Polyangiaceae bacterium]|nr:hypothetical protein [Polyangiaceae bacterium]
MRFTQPVDFDAAWSATMLGDQTGTPIGACAQMNGACVQSGHITTQDIELRLPAGEGGNVQRFFPGVLGMSLGGPALAPGSTPAQLLPDGSVSLTFQLCPQRDSQCAYF